MNFNKFDILYWFARLLTVKTSEEAINFEKDLALQLENVPKQFCHKREGFCECFDEGEKLCLPLGNNLFFAAQNHFLSLGLPLSISDDLDKLNKGIISLSTFRRFPNVDLLIRYLPKLRRSVDFAEDIIFAEAVESNHVDFCREILRRNLFGRIIFTLRKPPSPEMRDLLASFGMIAKISNLSEDRIEFDFDREISTLMETKNEANYFRLIVKVLSENVDVENRMRILKDIAGNSKLFYIIIYSCYFVGGIESAKNYLE